MTGEPCKRHAIRHNVPHHTEERAAFEGFHTLYRAECIEPDWPFSDFQAYAPGSGWKVDCRGEMYDHPGAACSTN